MSPPPKKRRQETRNTLEKSSTTTSTTTTTTSNSVDTTATTTKTTTGSPVLVHHIDYSSSNNSNNSGKRKNKKSSSTLPTTKLTLKSGLDELLAPLSKEEFLSHCLRKRAVHITTTNNNTKNKDCHRQRVSELCQEMCNLNPEMILRETSSDSIFLWLRPTSATTTTSTKNDDDNNNKDGSSTVSTPGTKDLIQSIEISDVETALVLHKTAGHATYCRAPPKVEQCLVSNLLRDTGLGCGQYDPSGESMIKLGRGEVETFISTLGHFTNWHYDFQENFTIQLSGTKRWTLQQGTIPDPIRGCTPHYAAPEAVESQLKAAHLLYDTKSTTTKFQFGFPQEGINAVGPTAVIDVQPGDVLYFPAGMWHKVETLVPGISINVSLMASNYATMTCQALQHYLMRDAQWREPVMQHNGTTSNTTVVDHLKRLLQELPQKIRELEQDGIGAQAILPPVLQYPPNFQVDEDEGEDGDAEWENVDDGDGPSSEEDSENGHDEDEGEEEKKVEDNDSGDVGSGLLPVEEDDDNNENDGGGNVVDPLTFDDYPQGWNYTVAQMDQDLRFIRNPLASLLKRSDITRFYDKNDGDGDSTNKRRRQDDITYVLNVNFAGNEMHESAVRIVFLDNSSTGVVRQLYQQERTSTGPTDSLVILATQEGVERITKFLVFHGYLLQS